MGIFCLHVNPHTTWAGCQIYIISSKLAEMLFRAHTGVSGIDIMCKWRRLACSVCLNVHSQPPEASIVKKPSSAVLRVWYQHYMGKGSLILYNAWFNV
jgi:hypothetical protein